MAHRHIGGMDRGAQIILGLAMIVGYFAQSDSSYSWLYLVAGILGLLAGLVGRSVQRAPCSLTTCRMK